MRFRNLKPTLTRRLLIILPSHFILRIMQYPRRQQSLLQRPLPTIKPALCIISMTCHISQRRRLLQPRAMSDVRATNLVLETERHPVNVILWIRLRSEAPGMGISGFIRGDGDVGVGVDIAHFLRIQLTSRWLSLG
jgi:hypothetical protein